MQTSRNVSSKETSAIPVPSVRSAPAQSLDHYSRSHRVRCHRIRGELFFDHTAV